MKRILATTALVALTSMPVFAQTDATDPAVTEAEVGTTDMMDTADQQVAPSDLINRDLYASSADMAPGLVPGTMDEPADDWDNVGSIDDLILTPDGEIDAIIVDVGGFFGIGARQVIVEMSEVTLVDETGSEGEFFVVFNGVSSELEDRPELDRTAVNDAGNSFHTSGNTAVGSDEGLTEEAVTEAPPAPETDDATETEMVDETDPMAPADDAATTGMTDETDPMVPADDAATTQTTDADQPFLSGDERSALTADDLMGTNVDDMSGERIGSISDIVLTDDGTVENVIINVGGFLGIGSKSVAVGFDEIELVREEGAMSTSLRATTTITADQFDSMPEWDG